MSFFDNIQKKVFAFLIGLIFASFLPECSLFLKENFGISFEYASYITLFIYFCLPILAAIIWVSNSTKFKTSFRDFKKIKTFESHEIIIKSVIFSLSVLFIVSLLVLPFHFIFPNVNVGIMLFFCIFIILDILYNYYIFKNLYFNQTKNDAYKSLVLEYSFLKTAFLIISIAFFCNQWGDYKEAFKIVNFDLGYAIFEKKDSLNNIEKLVESKYNETFIKQDTDTSKTKTDSLIKKNILKFNDIISQSAKIFDNFGGIENTDSLNKAIDLLKVFENNISKIEITKLTQKDFDNWQSLQRVVKALKIKYNEKFADYWDGVLKVYQIKGMFILITLLILVFSVWFHISLECLKQKPEGENNDNKNIKDLSVLEIKEIYKPKNPIDDYPEIDQSRNFIYLILLLVLPLFRQIDKEKISIDSPIIPASPIINFSNFYNPLSGGGSAGSSNVTNNFPRDTVKPYIVLRADTSLYRRVLKMSDTLEILALENNKLKEYDKIVNGNFIKIKDSKIDDRTRKIESLITNKLR